LSNQDPISYLTRALAIYEKLLDPEHPSTASTLNNLAFLYSNQSKGEKAEPLYLRALSIYKKMLGSDHFNTKIVRENYNNLLKKMDRREKR
jgi:tetratricopeptide (TPR) repeat protein